MAGRVYTLDVGNTRSKLACFEGDVLTDCKVFEDDHRLREGLAEISETVVACSVRGRIALGIQEMLWFDSAWEYPYGMDIEGRGTLGADRLAAVWGGVGRYPGKSLLIVDAGTCITYEYVCGGGRYLGGAISPGLAMRYKAMHEYTSALPELAPLGKFPPKVGRDTEAAMRSGVVHGIIGEIEARVEAFQSENEDSAVLFTGGDIGILGKPLKTGIFAEPMLLHYGLYYAYQSL